MRVWVLSLAILFGIQAISQPTVSFSINHENAFTFKQNAAILGHHEAINCGIYFEKLYMVEGVSNLLAAFTVPVKSGGFGFIANRFGSEEFNHNSFELAYARKLNTVFSIGAVFNKTGTKIKGYDAIGEFGYGLSAMLIPIEKLLAGFSFKRSSSSFNYSFAIGYDVSKIVSISCFAEKESDQSARFIPVLLYKPVEMVIVKAGIVSNSSLIFLGTGWVNKSFQIEISSNYHSQLGFSPGLTLQYRFSKK